MLKRSLGLGYGLLCYAVFFGVFLYAVGFLGNFTVPKAIDGPRNMPVVSAAAVNLALLAIFALQHSVMARPAFKCWWTRFVPEPLERSTYVLFSSLALILLFVAWQPMGGVIWHLENPLARGLMWAGFAFGWVTVLITTFLINHFDLFGLRQSWLYFRGVPYTPLGFVMPMVYRCVRHPLYVGWFCTFWFTPTMTAAHFVFAAGASAYILIAIVFEERDLIAAHGEAYVRYRESTPMFVPRVRMTSQSLETCPVNG